MHFHLPRTQTTSIHIRFALTAVLNTSLTIMQVIYAHKAHSVSLLSDALHNLGDVFGLFVAWGAQALLYSKMHPTRYTYGYQKATILAAFTNALLLLFSVGIIARETLFKLTHTDAMNEMQVLFIATLGVVINGLTALLFIKDKDTNLNIRAAFLHLILDALTSLGVVISALVIYWGGSQWIDSIMAVLIGSVILISGLRLLRRSVDLLLGAVPPHIELEAVTTYLKTLPDVIAIQQLHIWALSTEKAALTAHLVMKDTQNIDHTVIQETLATQFNITQVTLQPITHTARSTLASTTDTDTNN